MNDAASLAPILEQLLSRGIGVTAVALASSDASRDLTLVQWRALVVAALEDGIRVGELARRLGIAVPSASRLIRRLERRGYLVTVRDEQDRRATVVRATSAGAAVLAMVMERRRALLKEALESADLRNTSEVEATVRDLVRALARFA